MDKKVITEKMELEKEWFKEAAKVKTTGELVAFVNHILNDYVHDYGTACHAVAACALAGAWLGCESAGLSSFQASFVMWDFIKNWLMSSNVCGMKLIDYDEFLYPQYQYKFEKTIRKSVWESIQKEARKHLETDSACANVEQHWRNIAEGIVPFGYSVIDG